MHTLIIGIEPFPCHALCDYFGDIFGFSVIVVVLSLSRHFTDMEVVGILWLVCSFRLF